MGEVNIFSALYFWNDKLTFACVAFPIWLEVSISNPLARLKS